MAESILFDIAGQIIQKLSSKALEEVALWWGVKDEIKKLKDTVATIHAVLLDAEKKQEHNNQVKLWLGRLKDAMYDAEDLLDDFSTEGLQRQAMDGCRLAKEVSLFFSRSNQFAYGLKMGHKIKAVRDRLAGINADRQFRLEERLPHQDATTRTRSDRETNSVVPEVVIGRENDKKAIIGSLLDSKDFGVSVLIISIVGIGGLGKTTLAQYVFNDDFIQSYFELKLWVCVSDNFDIKTVMYKILECVTKTRAAEVETNTLIAKLHEIINGKRFLLVLDDVWDDNGERWDDLKKLLRGGGSGSRVLVTTRQTNVARIASEAVSPYFLEGLSEEESWSLLAKMAFGDGQESRKSSLEMVGREIVKKCAGVPLAIKTIGRVLYFKETREEWLLFKDKELLSVDQERTRTILPTLKLSYDHLLSHLKHCFTYCSLFPKDYRIHVETLIQLWIAQGFVSSSSNARECLQDIGLEYFKDLLWRSFFQEVEYDEWGNIESCKMHDLMHDLATSVGMGESHLVLEDGGADIRGNFRHVSFGFHLESLEQIPTELNTKAICLRTFLLPCQYWASQSIDWGAILHDFRGLRALDLHKLAIWELPASWGMKLKHLRYLDLSDNRDMRVLPDWITRLQNLQVLKLCGCLSLTKLPKDIRKLTNLGYLDCQGCDNLSHMPHGLGQLTSLWRLTVFVVGGGNGSSGASKHKYESDGLEELNGLNNLRGSLQIKNLGIVRNGEREFEAANLKGKNLLQSLILDWGRGCECNWAVVDIDYEERCFQRLQPHPDLKSLRVNGYGGVRFPGWFSSLTNLVRITIYYCGRCQCLPPFHQFPSLQDLEIRDLSELEYIVEDNDGQINNAESSSSSSSLSSSTLFFPSLKSLTLGNCLKLKGWWKNQGGDCDDGNNSATSTVAATVLLKLPRFHRLSKLKIWICPNLTQMPLFPSLTDELVLRDTSLEPLRQTMEMKRSSTMATSSSSGTLVMHPPPPPLQKLKALRLYEIGELESLPEEWLQNLTSLRELKIWSCPNLKSLPQGMKHQLTSLRRLSIWACPQLEERCGNKRGADWPIISHIPNIYIGSEDIQKDGRYLLDDGEEAASSC